MAKIGMFWGSSTEMTSLASEGIKEEIQNFGHDIDSVNIRDSGLEPILEYKNVIIGCPTWNVGELQDDWDLLYKDYQKLRFDNITGAFFGVGDQMGYNYNYLDAVGLLARPFMENGGKLIGRWSIEGYEFDESVALEGEEFLGLALDYDNQDNLSEERIRAWASLIQGEFQ
jgi:flavodoxin I